MGATTAAPTYFPPKEVKVNANLSPSECSNYGMIQKTDGCYYRLIDGSLFANSPAMLALQMIRNRISGKIIDECDTKYNMFKNYSVLWKDFDLKDDFINRSFAIPSPSLNNETDLTIIEIGTGKFNTKPPAPDLSKANSFLDAITGASFTGVAGFGIATIGFGYHITRKSRCCNDEDSVVPSITPVELVGANAAAIGTALSLITGIFSLAAKHLINSTEGIIGQLKKDILGDILESQQKVDLITSQNIFGTIAVNPEFDGPEIKLDSTSQESIDKMTSVTTEFLNNNSDGITALVQCLQNDVIRTESCKHASATFYHDFDKELDGRITEDTLQEL